MRLGRASKKQYSSILGNIVRCTNNPDFFWLVTLSPKMIKTGLKHYSPGWCNKEFAQPFSQN